MESFFRRKAYLIVSMLILVFAQTKNLKQNVQRYLIFSMMHVRVCKCVTR